MAEAENGMVKIGDKLVVVQILATSEEYFGTLYSARKYIEAEYGVEHTDLVVIGNLFQPGKHVATSMGNIAFTAVDECPARIIEANRFE